MLFCTAWMGSVCEAMAQAGDAGPPPGGAAPGPLVPRALQPATGSATSTLAQGPIVPIGPPDPTAVEAEIPPGPRQIKPKAERSLSSRLRWRWPEFRPYQYVLAAVQGLGAVASTAIPGEPRFTASNPLDDAVRDALRIDDRFHSRWARDGSDALLVLLFNQRLVDDLIVTWWVHDKGSTAWQLGLIDLQTISFAASLQSLVAGSIGRERPYGRSICDVGPESETSDCKGNNRYRSFFSGHATTAFTIAGLTCAHHIELPLYGGGPVEAVPCITSFLLAGGVATLRVASDQHYFTDVLTGAAFGTASGFAIPYLFHYMHDESPLSYSKNGIDLMIVPQPTGISVMGEF